LNIDVGILQAGNCSSVLWDDGFGWWELVFKAAFLFALWIAIVSNILDWKLNEITFIFGRRKKLLSICIIYMYIYTFLITRLDYCFPDTFLYLFNTLFPLLFSYILALLNGKS